MPTKPVQRFKAWSFSQLTDYEQCPLKAKLKKIDKLPEPESKAFERGNKIHKDAEDYSLKLVKDLPPSLENFEEEFADLRKRKIVTAEKQMAFTAEWKPTGWFDWNAYQRMVTDLYYVEAKKKTVTVIDYKTGQIYADKQDQLDLYGVGVLITFEKLDTALAQFWYLDQGEIMERTITRKDLPDQIERWNKRIQPMMNDTVFKPKPGNYCRWCHFSKSKGGPCPY